MMRDPLSLTPGSLTFDQRDQRLERLALLQPQLESFAFLILCDSNASRSVVTEVIQRNASTDEQEWVEPHLSDLVNAVTDAAFEMITRSEPENPLAFLTPRTEGPKEPRQMVSYLIASLSSLVERQVVLLMRHRDVDAVSELLGREAEDVKTIHDQAVCRLRTICDELKPARKAPDVSSRTLTPQEAQERFATRASQIIDLAYTILADIDAATLIVQKVLAAGLAVAAAGQLDVKHEWETLANLTFDVCKEHIIETAKIEKDAETDAETHEIRVKPADTWAEALQGLTNQERRCLILSTFYYKRDTAGLAQIASDLRMSVEEVACRIASAIQKVVDVGLKQTLEEAESKFR